MPFEEFDKKIRDAADHHHPAYHTQAWKEMEKLLNQHLPREQKDNRRLFLLIFLFLFLGGGLAVLITRPWKEKAPVASENKASEDHDRPVSGPITPDNSTGKEEQNNQSSSALQDQTRLDQLLSGKENLTPSIFNAKSNRNNQVSGRVIHVTDSKVNPPIVIEAEDKSLNPDIAIQSKADPLVQDKSTSKEPSLTPTNNNKKDVVGEQKITGTEKENKADIIEEAVAKNTKNKKNNTFFFSISAGPDLSAAGTSQPGKFKLTGGAGFGYTFNDKLTFKTGFYTGRKIYSASADEYNPPPSFWTYYPNLEKVDADCRVYEIPFQVSYHFGKTLTQNWFAGAGLSTYLMKQETYNYHYKQNGVYTTKKWTIHNENKHILSVLTVSGGYQRNISQRFSLVAEPYIKVPLVGVGYGKVRLNSAGVMISATMKPFGKK